VGFHLTLITVDENFFTISPYSVHNLVEPVVEECMLLTVIRGKSNYEGQRPIHGHNFSFASSNLECLQSLLTGPQDA
jgi:hypothetical protein